MDRYQVSMRLLISRLGGGGLPAYGRSSTWASMIGSWSPTISNPLGFGGEFNWALTIFSEGICSALVILGVLTRFTCVPPLIVSVVTALAMPAGTPSSVRETYLLYALPFFVLSFTGPGDYSVDARVAAWSSGRR